MQANPKNAGRDVADLRHFGARELVRTGQSVSGRLPLVAFTRLLDGLPPEQAGEVGWQAQGLEGPLGQPWLQLSVQAEPQVACQRCLQPFALPVQSSVTLELVASAQALDTDDEAMAEEPDDPDDAEGRVATPDKVLCAGGRLDLFEQIEDELILALPYIPRHSVCPQPLAASAGPEIAEASPRKPFAALEALKGSLRRQNEPDSQ